MDGFHVELEDQVIHRWEETETCGLGGCLVSRWEEIT